MRGGLDAVGVEALVAHRAHQRQQDAHHLRETSGHHRVGGNLFDGCLAVTGRNAADDALRGQRASLQHGLDSLQGRRHHWKGVAEVAKAELDGIFFVLDGDPAGGFGYAAEKRRGVSPGVVHRRAILRLRLQMARTAARLPGGRAVVGGRNGRVSQGSGQFVEPGLVESHQRFLHLAALVEEEHGGNGLRFISP